MNADAFDRLSRRMGAATTRRGLLRAFATGLGALAAGRLVPAAPGNASAARPGIDGEAPGQPCGDNPEYATPCGTVSGINNLGQAYSYPQCCAQNATCCSAANAACCLPNQTCYFGHCCNPNQSFCGQGCCDPNQTCCNGSCCDPSQDCENGACVTPPPPPPPANTCADLGVVCEAGQSCCGADENRPSCCNSNQFCNSSGYCNDNGTVPCDYTSCAAGDTCCRGPNGNTCCAAGLICCDLDGDNGPSCCCPDGGTLINGVCCPSALTCGNACCAAGEFCLNGGCCPLGAGCGLHEVCCTGDYFCDQSVAGGACVPKGTGQERQEASAGAAQPAGTATPAPRPTETPTPTPRATETPAPRPTETPSPPPTRTPDR